VLSRRHFASPLACVLTQDSNSPYKNLRTDQTLVSILLLLSFYESEPTFIFPVVNRVQVFLPFSQLTSGFSRSVLSSKCQEVGRASHCCLLFCLEAMPVGLIPLPNPFNTHPILDFETGRPNSEDLFFFSSLRDEAVN